MTSLNYDSIIDVIESIFGKCGNDEYLGEPVTMAQHMLQGATHAENAHEPDVVVAAALLHDVGHFTSEFGTFAMSDTEDKLHEQAGAKLLAPFFPALVTDCVLYHVDAKRYLCATDPSYFGKLSAASVHSLNLQGGKMTADEVKQFEQNPNLDAIVRVRLYDDQGKEPSMHTKSFAEYKPLLQRVVDSTRNTV